MNRKHLVHRALLLTLLLTLALPLAGQEGAEEPTRDTPAPADAENPMADMMAALETAMTPGPEHARLAETVGAWDLTVRMWMDPEAEPMVSRATASRKMIFGGRFLEETVDGNVMGMPFQGRALTGYDNLTDEYWSSWIDNMSTGIAVQRGHYDEEAGTFTMKGEFVDPVTGETIPVRSVIHASEDREEVEWWETRDGREIQTMELVYQRASGDEG